MKLALCSAAITAVSAALFTAEPDPVATLSSPPIELKKGSRIALVGNGLGSRMLHTGAFETGMHLRYPELDLFIRNMCDDGNTPAFRPHSGRGNQLAFPGAEAFHAPYTGGRTANGVGHFESEDEWLTRIEPDVIIGFFGFNESFQGPAGLTNFRAELNAWVEHTKAQTYGRDSAPQIALVSPTAYQDLTATLDVPDGKAENSNLAAYTAVMEAVAEQQGLAFVDAYNASLGWYSSTDEALTADGALLNEAGYAKLAQLLTDTLFGKRGETASAYRAQIADAVAEKNWFWINDFKIPNGVHVFGRRFKPFGPDNYPFEIEKVRQMTHNRDQVIWAATKGRSIDVDALDRETRSLPEVKTNFRPSNKNGQLDFLYGEDALNTISVPEGYKIEQWATEQEFPDLQNPVQMSFDNKGRLWVAVMPSYPHYRPGDPRPDDKLLILEDTDNDGKADKQTVFADGLHLPMGFEFAPEGVYVSQGINLVLLTDKDGDDRADGKEVILSGFDDHDTHHAISAYCADPSGALLMCEGVFLRTNVETAYGPVRGTDGGFYRYTPQRRKLERHAQLSIPNPWGVAFDDWGQHFFLHTSGVTVEWMLPGSLKPRYGLKSPGSRNLIEQAHRVRPTSGIEFLSSRHFPDEVQGDMLLNNTIGFLGTKQHAISEDGTGFKTEWRQDLMKSSDGNFRPVDLEVAPDGSLYVVDWHNPLIGHMQHNARDPNRDHAHGRVYRITYPSRPLVEPAKIHGATIAQLLENLKLPEYRTRYRTRRELRGRDADEVLAALGPWVEALDKNDPDFEHQRLEALWVKWGLNRIDGSLLREVLASPDHRARAAAVRVARYSGHRIGDQAELMTKAAADEHGRVRLEAIVAASWLDKKDGLAVLAAAESISKTEPKVESPNVQITDGGGRITVKPELGGSQVDQLVLRVPGKRRIINLAEVQIFSGGKNIAASATWELSSEYQGGMYPAKNLIDGDLNNFAHTHETTANPRVVATFASPVAIDSVTIFNRKGFESRFDGARVIFRNGKKKIGEFPVDLGGKTQEYGPWITKPFNTARSILEDQVVAEEPEVTAAAPSWLKGENAKLYNLGAEVYARDAHCATCHQPDGAGLPMAGFPPLAGTKWVNGNKERLIKLTLHGLWGEIEVQGKTYPKAVPMTAFKGLLNDDELAAVLTFVRNSFGNKSDPVSPAEVKAVRAATAGQEMLYEPAELLKQHPMTGGR